jgi:hypothetical protein
MGGFSIQPKHQLTTTLVIQQLSQYASQIQTPKYRTDARRHLKTTSTLSSYVISQIRHTI